MVKTPLTLSFEELQKKPQTKMISTLECIGNTVGGYSIGTAEWEGVKINHLLDEVGFDPKAFDLVLRGADDYSDSFPLSRALEDDVLLATKMNGVPLPPDHGFPARVIVPGIYGMKNVKWLTGLDLVNYDYKGHWQQQSWSDTALVKLSSRIDLPGDRELITTPRYTMKGIAFNGRLKIHKMEISIDAGKTWQNATLKPKLLRRSVIVRRSRSSLIHDTWPRPVIPAVVGGYPSGLYKMGSRSRPCGNNDGKGWNGRIVSEYRRLILRRTI